jgi:diguanylate cyclase (GGDEF)-like protein
MAQIEMFTHGLTKLSVPKFEPMKAVGFGDIDVLLNAVMHRLRLSVGECPTSDVDPTMPLTIQRAVLECTQALDQLHNTFKQELERHQRQDLAVFDLQTALAQSRAELAGIQLGGRLARLQGSEDGLALLPDKRLFHERLNYALKLAAPQRRAFAVLYLDLDGFKPISDIQGKECADELLKIVATRMTHAIRAEDMVSQLGDEEFGCLLADLPSREQLGHLAVKLIDAVSAPVKVGKFRFTVKPTIGVATCPADGVTGETLIRHADSAMRRAKQHQIGHAFFDGAPNH